MGREGPLGGQSASCTDSHTCKMLLSVVDPSVQQPGARRVPLAVSRYPGQPCLLPSAPCLSYPCAGTWIKCSVYTGKSVSRYTSTGGWCWYLPLPLKRVSSYLKFMRCLDLPEDAGAWRRIIWTRETGQVVREEQARRRKEKNKKFEWTEKGLFG